MNGAPADTSVLRSIEIKPVAAGLRQQLRFCLEFGVNKTGVPPHPNRARHAGGLEMHTVSGVRVSAQSNRCIQVSPGPPSAASTGSIARAQYSKFNSDRTCRSSRSFLRRAESHAVLGQVPSRLPGIGLGIPGPLDLPVFWTSMDSRTRAVVRSPRPPTIYVIADHQWRHGRK